MMNLEFIDERKLVESVRDLRDGDMALVYNQESRGKDFVVTIDETDCEGSGLFLSVVTGLHYSGEFLSLIRVFKDIDVDCESLTAVLR